jgi:hypothetical protein
LRRGNRHLLTDYGWLHEQDNTKILRSTEGDKIIAMEKGLNKYKRVDDSKCAPAIKWWSNTRAYWIDVREVWDEIFAEGEDLNFEKKIDNVLLWERLFSLEEDAIENNKANTPENRQTVRKIINEYLKD